MQDRLCTAVALMSLSTPRTFQILQARMMTTVEDLAAGAAQSGINQLL